jgi:hypothetical protein
LIRQTLKEWEEAGTITRQDPSVLRTVSRLKSVPKPGEPDKRRVCGIFCQLNNDTRELRGRFPTTKEVLASCKGAQWFAKVDLKSAYLSCPVEEDTKKDLGIYFEGVFYRFERLPFGVKNAVAHFSNVMAYVLRGIDVAHYLDDIPVCGATPEEVKAKLDEVLRRLKEAGFKVNAEKSVLRPSRSIVILGQQVSAAGLRIPPEKKRSVFTKVEQILSSDGELTMKEAAKIRGTLNYYRPSWPATQRFLHRLSVNGKAALLKHWREIAAKEGVTAWDGAIDRVVTDASTAGWCAEFYHGRRLLVSFLGQFTGSTRGWPIYRKEAEALIRGWDKMLAEGREKVAPVLHWHTDNQCNSRKGRAFRYVEKYLQPWTRVVPEYRDLEGSSVDIKSRVFMTEEELQADELHARLKALKATSSPCSGC